MRWKKRRQRKWKKDKEKGRWTMRMGTGKEDNENDKSEGIILEGSRFKKKRTRILEVRETI
jgi:hypothetical protein